MAKHIAVIANNLQQGVDYLLHNYKFKEVNRESRKLIDIHDNIYRIITLPEHSYGYVFQGIIDAGGSFELMSQVRNRVVND